MPLGCCVAWVGSSPKGSSLAETGAAAPRSMKGRASSRRSAKDFAPVASRAEVSMGITLGSIGGGLIGPFLGPFIDRRGARAVLVAL